MDGVDRRRHVAFGLALAVLAGVAVSLTLMGRGGSEPDARQGGVESSIAAGTRPMAPVPEAASRVAAVFARAFVRYETGDLGPAVRSALRKTCSGIFAAQLLSAPVRVPVGTQPPAESFVGLVSVGPSVISGLAGVEAMARIVRRGRAAALRISLIMRGTRWQVVGVGR